MSEWSSGYVSELGYTYGYYRELNPKYIPFSLALRGYAAPKVETALELGFGQGISVNFHAAGSDVNWWERILIQARLPSPLSCREHRDLQWNSSTTRSKTF